MANDHAANEDFAQGCPEGNGKYLCTKEAGHSGDHVATILGGAVVGQWPQVHAPTSDGCEQNGTHEKCCGTKRFISANKNCTCGARRTLQHNLGCPLRQYDIEQYSRSPAIDALEKFKKESAERKAAPLWSGCMCYFPDALLAVARLSKKANDKHNPGEPLHWSKEKSNDHGDCIARHQLNPEQMDEEIGEIHAVMVAWRAMAQLQTIIERQRGK